MCLSGHRRFPYGSANPAVRARAHEITEKAVLFAREFGIRVIQLAGYDVYYEPSTPESLRLFEEGLRSACKIAEKYQVMLAMEIMDTPLHEQHLPLLKIQSRPPLAVVHGLP